MDALKDCLEKRAKIQSPDRRQLERIDPLVFVHHIVAEPNPNDLCNHKANLANGNFGGSQHDDLPDLALKGHHPYLICNNI